MTTPRLSKRSATVLYHIHLCMTVVWASLALPTVLWWRNSILWVAFMSLYANMVGHWSALQACRAERDIEGATEVSEQPPGPGAPS